MSTRLTALARQSKAGRPQPPLLPQRERGLWSFLTWSFFLSQVLAAESFLGSSARAAGDGDASANSPDASAAQASLLPALPLAGARGTDQEGATPLQGVSGLETAAQPHALAGPPAPNEPAADQYAGEGAESMFFPHGQGSFGGIAATRDPAQAGNGAELPQAPVPDLPGDPMVPLGPIVGGVLEPVVDTVTDVVGSLGPIPGQVLAPVAELVGGITQALADIVGEVVTPLLSAVGDLLAPIVQSVVTPIADLLGNLLQPVGDLLGDPIAPVAASLEPVLAPLVDTVEPILQPLGAIVDDVAAPLTDALGLQGLVASTGNIVLAELPIVGSLNLDDLFTANGQYTDYNLALDTGISAAAPVIAVADTATTILGDILSDALGSQGADDHSGQPAGLLGPLTGVLDDLHSRSLGEALGL